MAIMSQIIYLTLLTVSAAHTTYRYDGFENYGNYRSAIPYRDYGLSNTRSNGERTFQNYGYANIYSDVNYSDSVINQRRVFNNNDRRSGLENNYPQRNGDERDNWHRRTVNEQTRQNNENYRNPHYPTEGHVTQNLSIRDQQRIGLNKTVNTKTTHINTQLDDASRTLIPNGQQIAYNNNYNEPNLAASTANQQNTDTNVNSNKNVESRLTFENINDETIISNDNPVNLNVNNNSSKQDKKSYQAENFGNGDPRKSNQFRIDSNINNTDRRNKDIDRNNNTGNSIHRNTNGFNYHGMKTTQDNEVTSRPQEGKTDKEAEDDRWIWPSDDVKETTTISVDDRAAFSGNECPTGTIKVGGKCVVPD